ncbi:hypothetical protein ACQ4PT_018998 [Festuca glaucescens]
MVLPLVKLGSLAFRTLSKPIAGRLKHHAGVHPKFRGFIIGLAQVTLASAILSACETRPYAFDPLFLCDVWIAAYVRDVDDEMLKSKA